GVYKAFEIKKDKTDYDRSLMKLFESSLRYKNDSFESFEKLIENLTNEFEKYYVIDIISMAFWSDKLIDEDEQLFLDSLSEKLNVSTEVVKQSLIDLDNFYDSNKDKIALLNSKNPVQSFYDNSGKMVSKLIKRNRKRLQKEIQESKELMKLLSKSTVESLSEEEQKRVQGQLLDIFKTI